MVPPNQLAESFFPHILHSQSSLTDDLMNSLAIRATYSSYNVEYSFFQPTSSVTSCRIFIEVHTSIENLRTEV